MILREDERVVPESSVEAARVQVRRSVEGDRGGDQRENNLKTLKRLRLKC